MGTGGGRGRHLALAGRVITTEKPAFVMGIMNATPDSFFAESRGTAERALRLIDEGADILDIGGESTRPGATYMDTDEEIRRVVPVVRAVRKHSAVPISVDTRKSAVLRAALDEGADMLNDISALEDDEEMAEVAAHAKIPVILMHKRGIPAIMQEDAAYDDVFGEVDAYLQRRIRYARERGIAGDRIVIDPGIGFGKDAAANVALIRRCGGLCGGRYPVLMGLSRKRIVGALTGRGAEERLAGTLAANVLAVIAGASLLRVHDVRETVDMLAVLDGIGY